MIAKCPVCSAEFKVPETVSVATCPYCGTTFNIVTKQQYQDHFFFPVMKKDPGGLLLKQLTREYGCPYDILNAPILSKTLHYIPVYFFYVEGYLEGTSVKEVLTIPIVAVKKFEKLLKDYRFPIRGKRFFDESIIKKGIYYEPEIDKIQAEIKAKEKLMKILKDEAKQSGDKFKEKNVYSVIVFQGLVHYPIWEIHYEYQNKELTCYLDGVDGRIIYAKYPITSKARIGCLLFGLAILFIGIVIPYLICLIYPPFILSLLLSAIASIISAGYFFFKALFKFHKTKEIKFGIDTIIFREI